LKIKDLIGIFLSKHFLKFAIVGGFATILNYGLFFALFKLFNVNYLISSATGYISGVILGFYLNKTWTFESESKEYVPEVIKYFIVYAISLVVGLGLLKILVSYLNIHPLVANIGVIGCTTIMNFIGTKFFVFQKKNEKNVNFLVYRYRFLLNYIIIGFLSIIIEVIFIELAKRVISIKVIYLTIIGFVIGALLSFALNSKLNFKVPKEKRIRTFKIFMIIATGSYLLNMALYYFISSNINLGYAYLRFVTAACIFVISYTLHRRFTFTDVKSVGIAIYLRKDENIDEIWEKIKNYPDFIHIDLVDETFNPAAKEIDFSKGYELKKKWIDIKTMTHIMSKYPSKYIDKISPFSDIIIIHVRGADTDKIIDYIKKINRKVGICLNYSQDFKKMKRYFKKVDVVQVLGIKEPGVSGQFLQKEALETVVALNSLKSRYGYKFDICFDGGVKRENINQINAKYVVSSSSVLNADAPVNTIFELKTNSAYFSKMTSLKNTVKMRVMDIGHKNKNIFSLSIVGSFLDKNDMSSMSDIDIIIIVHALDKMQYSKIIKEFEELKKNIETDYKIKVKINDTFGPLKFDDEFDVVFHVMIYDFKGHLLHSINSPFTVLDWERSEVFVKKRLTDASITFQPQPFQIINSRRSIESYGKDIKSKTINYRKYIFRGNSIKEIELNHKVADKDRVEYMYHVMKFTILNFMKVYHQANFSFNKDVLNEFFELTEISSKSISFFVDISKRKSQKKFFVHKSDTENLKKFLEDVKEAYDDIFVKNTKSMILIRHHRTDDNKKGVFLGQLTDSPIVNDNHPKLHSLSEMLKDVDCHYSSPLRRAIETAKHLNKHSKKEIILNQDLAEIDYGLADGKDINYLRENHPSILDQWEKGEDPKFPGGENYEDVKLRTRRFLNNVAQSRNKKISVITHNVVMRIMLGEVLKIPQKYWHRINIDHLDAFEFFYCEKNGRWYINTDMETLKKIYLEVYGEKVFPGADSSE